MAFWELCCALCSRLPRLLLEFHLDLQICAAKLQQIITNIKLLQSNREFLIFVMQFFVLQLIVSVVMWKKCSRTAAGRMKLVPLAILSPKRKVMYVYFGFLRLICLDIHKPILISGGLLLFYLPLSWIAQSKLSLVALVVHPSQFSTTMISRLLFHWYYSFYYWNSGRSNQLAPSFDPTKWLVRLAVQRLNLCESLFVLYNVLKGTFECFGGAGAFLCWRCFLNAGRSHHFEGRWCEIWGKK